MSSTNAWSLEMLGMLNRITRECMFDWEKVATKVQEHVHSVGYDVQVNAVICREQFALSNTVQLPPEAVAAADANNAKKTSRVENLDEMSLEELIDHVEKTELDMIKRKEEIFQRVLHSLGGKNETAAAYQDATTSAYLQALAQKDEMKRKQELRAFEALERERLESERENLKKRFDPDSQDAVGEYPELNTSIDSNNNDDGIPDIDGAMLEHILGSHDFDVILSELEKELDAQAVGKDDGEISELGEILNFLDSEANSKKKATKANNDESAKITLPSFEALLPKPPTSKQIDDVDNVNNSQILPPPPPAATAASKTDNSQLKQQVPSTVNTNNANSNSNSNNAPRANPSANNSRGGRGGRAEYVIESDNEGDEDDEDDNENWRKNRKNIKKHTDNNNNIPEAPAKPGFWGAYGESGQQARIPREIKEAAEIVLEIARAQAQTTTDSDDEQSIPDSDDASVTENVNSFSSEKVEDVDKVETVQVENESHISPELEPTAIVPPVEAISSSPESKPQLNEDIPVVDPEPQIANEPQLEVSSSLSGSLLSQAGSRRNKGKGPIMSASTRTSKKAQENTRVIEVIDTPNVAPVVDIVPTDSAVIEHQIVIEPNIESITSVQESDSIAADTNVNEVIEDPLITLTREKLEVPISSAPHLSLLPWTSVVDKAKGIKLNNKHAATMSAECDTELADLMIFKIDCLKDLFSGDLFYVSVIEELIEKLSDSMRIVAVWKSVFDDSFSYKLIFQTKLPGNQSSLSASYWKQWLQTTTFGELKVISGFSVLLTDAQRSVNLAKFVQCEDYFTNIDLILQALEEANLEDSHRINIMPSSEDEKDLNIKLLKSVDLQTSTVCVLKDYIFLDMHVHDHILCELVFHAESLGLRVLGMKLVFAPAKDRMLFKKFTACDIHTTSVKHPETLLLPLLCVAFCSGKSNHNSADVVRSILGPEDPVLAKKTDPNSLRARFGTDRDHNIAYSTPFSKEKLSSELKFWFGAREGSVTADTTKLNALLMPAARKLLLGIKIYKMNEEVTGVDASALLKVQSASLQLCLEKMQQVSLLESIDTIPLSQLSVISANKSGSEISKKMDNISGTASIAQVLVVTFSTFASDLHVEKCWNDLISCLDGNSYYKCNFFIQSQSLHFTVTSTSTLSTGSKYAALQALKKVPIHDYKSHEDVGLSDSIVLQFTDPEYSAASSIEKLASLISFLPATCNPHILGVKSAYHDDSNNSLLRSRTIWIVLRGYQLIENIDHAIQELKASMLALTHSNKQSSILDNITYIKGKKASELIFSEFGMDSLYVDLPFRDLQEYVPCSHEFISSDISGKYSLESIAHAIFPPGNFQALAALVVPWSHTISSPSKHQNLNHSSTVYTRNISRIVARLEKEHFNIISIFSTKSIPESILSDLYKENIEEYLHTTSGENPSWSDYYDSEGNLPCTVILVLRKSALLKIKSIVGPIFNDDIALLQYPRSLSALLASLSPNSSNAPSTKESVQFVATNKLPVLLPTLTCKSLDNLVKKCAQNNLTLVQQLQSIKSSDNAVKSEEDEENATIESIWTIVNSYMESDIALERRVTGKSSKLIIQPKLSMSSNTPSSIQAKTSNIAGIVITHSLIKMHGLGMIMEAIHREGLWITNALTTRLNGNTARLLLEAAGASSLTMKPAKDLMLDGPVICLGLCGPMHSFVRFKSFTTSAKSSTSVWMLNETEFGVLASSSSSLAKELYCLCFESILGDDSPFEIVGLDCQQQPTPSH